MISATTGTHKHDHILDNKAHRAHDKQPKDQFIGAALTLRKLQKMKVIPPQITPINLDT